ncbi:hypothetical protein ACHAW5_003866 [Stephanodiscus triporus]|uniref:subtilisin n=1 Tax=Stephanodiscus triporus TaxID=2934178 RepID=A0ABD3MRK3_9STRA
MNLANAFAVLLLTQMAVAEDVQGQRSVRGAEERKTYIVTFNSGKPEEMANGLAKFSGGEVNHVYTHVLNGAALTIPAQAAAALAKNPAIERIEEDQEATAFASATVESWGQNRIDQCALLLDGTTFNRMDASSVRVSLTQASTGSYYTRRYFPPTDGYGHGTHVASTVCGHKYGVVTCKELCAVKVLSDSGSGSYSNIIAGIEFVVKNCANGMKCVANMSLGGGFSTSLNTAVNNAVDLGVTFVVAAGNSNADACYYSPASASKAITVGAIDSSDNLPSWTNYGLCVDVYGPGVSIKAAWIGSTSATNTISGTSMASPHTCGLAAAALELGMADPETDLKGRATNKTIDCRSPGTGISVNPNLDCSSTTLDCPH